MSSDTRRDLLLGIDSMITKLLTAVRFERRIYDNSFHEVGSSPEISDVNSRERKTTSCKATQTVQTFPVSSDICDPLINLRLNKDSVSQHKCDVSKYASSGFTSSGHRSCCSSIAHRCEEDINNRFTIACPSHPSLSCSCSFKLYQDKYCSTPKCNNINLSRTGYITTHSNHIISADVKDSRNERRTSSTSGCSTACSSCQRHTCGLVTPKYPSELFPNKSDCSCSCNMHVLSKLS
ncbi:unnamed protein product [Schistosoma rodhaini]|uniref:Uncharacterized protein n=1 Tax=Schistosoma mansoni TaxID=6183 RepID=G4V6C9_SCHMA|nr:hypothetical protein Smp_124280 [Schistosoma mansoni]CAH8432926.1 unnamed protein product [Schistosoma rodhaini]|eukprot:XP_018647633.1 hypothetical protein Smp_124280 [Schistosoma mansoni]